MKRRKIRDAADANRYIRAGLRKLLSKLGRDSKEWAPLWVRVDADGTCAFERLYGGEPVLRFRPEDLPIEARPIVAELVELLNEQAWMARIAYNVAQAELEAQAKRERGGAQGAAIQRKIAEKPNKALLGAARSILADEPRLKIEALAATLADRGYGGKEAIVKKLRKAGLGKKS